MLLASPFQHHRHPLSFDHLIENLRRLIEQFPDKRTGQNTQHTMTDIALAAFSVFFTPSPSFLAHQTAMAEAKSKSNAHMLFKLQGIPSDNHIRDLLDYVPAHYLFPMFKHIVAALHESGHRDTFRAVDQQLLIALDGTQYHASNRVHCDHCTVKLHRNGTSSYSHTVITPVIVKPGYHQVIPLEPEFITPQDSS